jgi:hypothetical protein
MAVYLPQMLRIRLRAERAAAIDVPHDGRPRILGIEQKGRD